VSAYERLRVQLVQHRRHIGMTQAKVADAMGTTQSAVSDLERGRTKDPCMATLAKWAYALELELIVEVRNQEKGAA
jgi:transcriptional regulator with XRE-family HTH domain